MSYICQNEARLCANVPKGAPQQLQRADKEQFKTKWRQTIYNVKYTFTQKQILRQNKKFNLLSANKVSEISV